MKQRMFRIGTILFILASIFSLSLVMGQSLKAHANVVASSTPCLQAPTNLDPATLSQAQLRAYGLPERPANPTGQAEWLNTANRIKHDRHICQTTPVTGTLAHHSLHYSSPRISNTPDYGANEAGWYATGYYTIASANWNLPCMNTSFRNASASMWVGLGGEGSDTGYLVQDGTDVFVDSHGNVSYTSWIESTQNRDYSQTWSMPIARCGDSVYAEADSNVNGDNLDYFIVDSRTLDISHTESWPISDGSTTECIVEFPNNSTTSLADFKYVVFSNCEGGYVAIGDFSPSELVMKNTAGQTMAYPSALSGTYPDNFTVYWVRAG